MMPYSFYQLPDLSIWSGRDDTKNERLFQKMNILDCNHLPASLPQNSLVFLGFASDEGVRRNLGRIGAAKGPESLRKALGNLPFFPCDKYFWDAGNVFCVLEGDLEKSQQILGQLVHELRQRGAFVIVLGGGHEMAWGHFQGLAEQGCDVVNFDAHFDLRPLLENTKGSSGTSFRQIHEYSYKKNIPCRYACLGVQPFGNTNTLFDYAKTLPTYYAMAEKMVYQPVQVHESLATWLSSAKRIYLTLCLDVFAAAYAPGVSAPQAMGLTPPVLLPFFRQVLESGKVIGFDIAELNPAYDRDNQTAALGAYFIGEVLKSY
jgi:formiminoglutamase